MFLVHCAIPFLMMCTVKLARGCHCLFPIQVSWFSAPETWTKGGCRREGKRGFCTVSHAHLILLEVFGCCLAVNSPNNICPQSSGRCWAPVSNLISFFLFRHLTFHLPSPIANLIQSMIFQDNFSVKYLKYVMKLEMRKGNEYLWYNEVSIFHFLCIKYYILLVMWGLVSENEVS